MIQTTLARLMSLIMFIAIGLVALSRPSAGWASAVFTMTLAVMLAALVGAFARRGRSRLMFIGFALFGWCHLAISFGPWPWLNGEGLRPPAILTATIRDNVALHRLSGIKQDYTKTVSHWTPDMRHVLYDPYQVSLQPGIGARVVITDSPPDQILHSLGAIVFGFLGAVLSLAVVGRDDRPPDSPSAE